MDNKILLQHVIETYENDIPLGKEEEDAQRINAVFADIIVCLTRLVLDFRYCSNNQCKCSPEYGLKHIFRSDSGILKKYLYKHDYEALSELSK